jgi:hypothetical protein
LLSSQLTPSLWWGSRCASIQLWVFMIARGLLNKITVGRPYEDAAALLDEQHYDMCPATERPATSGSFEPIESDSLAAATSPGTGYDRDRALQLIQERYESVCETIPKTLATLRRRAWPRAHHPPAR